MEKLTDREVDVMMAIWNSSTESVPTGEILRHINRAKRNSLQTLQVVLRRLCEKCVIECEKGKQTNLYRAMISQTDYLKFANETFILHHYHDSPKMLLIALLREMQLSDEELGEILNSIKE